MKNGIKKINMKRMAIVVALAMAASVHPCATYAETVDFAKAPPAGQHCIYDAVPLEGAWEMSYCSNAWDSVECPLFKGVTVAKAVPGFWENMVPALRAAGMKDAFRINPAYERQTIPMTQWAKCTTLPNIYGCFLYRRTFTLDAKSFRFGGRGAPALPTSTSRRARRNAWRLRSPTSLATRREWSRCRLSRVGVGMILTQRYRDIEREGNVCGAMGER